MGSLQLGLAALKQKRYDEAEAQLKEASNQATPYSEDHLQALMGLARVYFKTQRWQQTGQICQDLLASGDPIAISWAQRALKDLPTSSVPQAAPQATDPLPQPASLSDPLQPFETLLLQERYPETIDGLQDYLKQLDPGHPDYSQAQLLLAKAYLCNGQSQEAQSLAETLTQYPETRHWAQDILEQVVVLTTQPQPMLNTGTNPAGSPQLTGIAAALAQVATPSDQQNTLDQSGLDYSSLNSATFKPKEVSEFREYGRIHLLPALKRIEVERLATLRSIGVATVVWLIISSVIVFYGRVSPLILVGALPLCFLGWVVSYDFILRSYGSGFKYTVIQKIIEYIDPSRSLRYSNFPPTQHGSWGAFVESTLFGSQLPAQFREDDCVYGRLGETDFYFSEIFAESESLSLLGTGLDLASGGAWLQLGSRDHNDGVAETVVMANLMFKMVKGIPYVVRRITQGRRLDITDFFVRSVDTETTRKTLFKGLFFRAGFNKSFTGRTVVLPNGAARFLGPLGEQIQAWNKKQGQVIRLEDPEFRNYFVVYGDDQIEARYLLSTSLMDKLVSFRKKANRPVYVSFVGQRIYIAVKYDEDLFEPKLYQSMRSFDPIREYFEMFQMMLGIVEDLKLNRRIWSRHV